MNTAERHAHLATICARAYTVTHGRLLDLEFMVEPFLGGYCIGVRGSEFSTLKGGNWRDYLRNARLLPWFNKATGWAHAGYLRGAENLVDVFGGLIPQRAPLYLCGHSMGAAVAVLGAQLLHARGHNVIEAVLLGSPRVYLRPPSFDFPVTHYRYGGDCVVQIHKLYQTPAPWEPLGENPRPGWADHGVALYAAALVSAAGITETEKEALDVVA